MLHSFIHCITHKCQRNIHQQDALKCPDEKKNKDEKEVVKVVGKQKKKRKRKKNDTTAATEATAATAKRMPVVALHGSVFTMGNDCCVSPEWAGHGTGDPVGDYTVFAGGEKLPLVMKMSIPLDPGGRFVKQMMYTFMSTNHVIKICVSWVSEGFPDDLQACSTEDAKDGDVFVPLFASPLLASKRIKISK